MSAKRHKDRDTYEMFTLRELTLTPPFSSIDDHVKSSRENVPISNTIPSLIEDIGLPAVIQALTQTSLVDFHVYIPRSSFVSRLAAGKCK